ncbi:hypothetical protein Tco_0827390 [Tanacetum coccineum]
MTITIRDNGYWHAMPGDYFFDVQLCEGFRTICLLGEWNTLIYGIHARSPSIAGDIAYIDYLFLGDYVHRGTANNAGAILVLGRDLVVVPKLIHPLPLAISSPETSPERHIEYTWMQELNANRPPTSTRGRPQVANEHGHAYKNLFVSSTFHDASSIWVMGFGAPSGDFSVELAMNSQSGSLGWGAVSECGVLVLVMDVLFSLFMSWDMGLDGLV